VQARYETEYFTAYECKHSTQKIFVSQCTLKTAYTIYIENVKTLEIGKDIRGIMCESM